MHTFWGGGVGVSAMEEYTYVEIWVELRRGDHLVKVVPGALEVDCRPWTPEEREGYVDVEE